MLYCDSLMTRLYWRHPDVGPDEEDLSMTAEAALAKAAVDRRLTKGSRSRRSSFFGKSESDREIYVRDIVDVRDDIFTEVMLRAYEKKAFGDPDYYKIISVICKGEPTIKSLIQWLTFLSLFLPHAFSFERRSFTGLRNNFRGLA